MKRLIGSVLAVVALFALPAAANAHKVTKGTLTLSVTPAVIASGDTFALGGTLRGVEMRHVTLSGVDEHGTTVLAKTKVHVLEHEYSLEVSDTLPAGTYTFWAKVSGNKAPPVSATLTVKAKTVAVVAPVFPETFLCYSTYQVEPGVWSMPIAEKLYASGYWLPFAVTGTVSGGTNLGGYHLVCNLATGQSVPSVHGYVDGGGAVLGPDLHDAYAAIFGVYPIAG